MDFFKKNLVFFLSIIICLLAFAAGAFLAVGEAGKVKSAQSKIDSAEAQLKSFLMANPSPTTENVAASDQDRVALTKELEKIRENLQRGSRINVSGDGVGVMAGIQQHISEYQARVENQTSADGEAAPIAIPAKFGFGFDKYIDTGSMLEDGNPFTMQLDKQRQVLSYIINQLIDSSPASITAVKREVLEVQAAGKAAESGFQINPAISARVSGAIETMAFSVTFTGYTDSLRSFLNNLAEFELPIVVRSVEVERPQGSSTTQVRSSGTALDDIFGAFGGGPASTEAVKVAQKPVISENVSDFTVVLEFIEIILPSDSENNPS